jgi:hypothetical protein
MMAKSLGCGVLLAFLLAACGDDSTTNVGSGGGSPTSSSGDTTSSDASTSTSASTGDATSSSGEGAAGGSGDGGSGVGGGAGGDGGGGGSPACDFSPPTVHLTVTLPDGSVASDEGGDVEDDVDLTIDGTLVVDGSTFTVEDGDGGVTTVELEGSSLPPLAGGAVALRVVATAGGFADGVYVELQDDASNLLFAAAAGGVIDVPDAAVTLALGAQVCLDEAADEDDFTWTTYALSVTVAGETVEVDPGDVASLPEAGLDVEHAQTLREELYEDDDLYRGVVVRAATN